jgi:hypothetical protein
MSIEKIIDNYAINCPVLTVRAPLPSPTVPENKIKA